MSIRITTMLPSISLTTLIAIAALCISLTQAQTSDPALVGTWTTKSKQVMTGPGFYNPVADKFTEPSLTGISYSFTSDGWFEEAYYRAISNPTTPSCPQGIMQWQHGRYTLPGNGSIILTPIAVDGRQLTSAPCSYDSSLYVRYHQPEMMLRYSVYTDPFHGVKRLDIYQFNGVPMHPMFLVASPPQMLPTQTLNPTTAATGASATGNVKRREVERQHIMGTLRIEDMGKDSGLGEEEEVESRDVERWWWAGVAMFGVGAMMYMIPTSK